MMAHYTPDYKYKDGEKHLKELKGKKGELIRYYVQQKQKHIDKLQERIDEMQKVFNGIRKYTM